MTVEQRHIPKGPALSSGARKDVGWTDYLLLLGVAVGGSMFVIAPPAGVNPAGWHVLGLLIPVIIVWATEAMPSGIATVFFLSVAVGCRFVHADIAFKGFTTHLPWLLAGAFALGTAMTQSGLSKRMTFLLLSRLKGVWGIIGAVYASNIFLIGVPSASARAAILAPVLSSIMGSIGRPTESKTSLLLTFNFVNSAVTLLSVLSLTGGAGNVVALALYQELTGKTLGWTQWLVIMALPTAILIGMTFIASVIFARPEPELVARLKDSNAAKEAYNALGPMSIGEWKVVGLFATVVALWAFSDMLHWDPGFEAMFVAGLLFLPRIGVLKAKDLREVNWDIVLLVGGVVGMAGILQATGIIKVVSDALVGPLLTPLAAYGLAGVALGTLIVNLIAHFLLPAPTNVTLVLPLLISWGITTMGFDHEVVLAFLVMLSAMNTMFVAMAYQMPPQYIFLGQNVTNVARFNGLLMKIYPIAALSMFIGAFVIYWTIKSVNFGM